MIYRLIDEKYIKINIHVQFDGQNIIIICKVLKYKLIFLYFNEFQLILLTVK